MIEQQQVIDAAAKFQQTSDDELVERMKVGDREAFKQIYQRHIGRVYKLCWRLTGQQEQAEESAQEVFIQVWQKIANFRGDSQFSTWLHSVTTHTTMSYLRKQKPWWQVIFPGQESIPEMTYQDNIEHQDLDKLIMQLPERARQVFVLHAIEGLRHEEIANLLNMAIGSSKAQFHRAKNLLKARLVSDE